MYYLHKFDLRQIKLDDIFMKLSLVELNIASNEYSQILYAGSTKGEISFTEDVNHKYRHFNKQITFKLRTIYEELYVMLFGEKFRIISKNIYNHSEINNIIGPIIQIMLNKNIPLREEFKN